MNCWHNINVHYFIFVCRGVGIVSLSPTFTRVSSMMSVRLNAIEIDIDCASTIASDFGICSVQIMMFVKNKEIIYQRICALPPSN
jgi:hypothetical protein